MRFTPLAILLISLHGYAQRADREFQTMAREAAASADAVAYLEPEFKWDMDGRVQVELNEGINYLKEGKPNIAVEKFNAALKLDPKLWIASYYKGACLKLLGQYANAAYEFGKADKINPRNFEITIELAKTHDLLKNDRNAERYFKSASMLRPDSGLPSYLLGNHFLGLGKLPAAREQFETSLNISPMMLDAEVKLGVLAAAEGKSIDVFLPYFSNALKKDSLHQQALFYHGMATFDSDRKASLKDWQKLVRLNPGNPYYRMILGSLNTTEGRYNEGFSEFRKVIELAQLNENKFVGQQTSYDKAIDVTNAGYYTMTKIYGFSDEDASEIRKAYCLLFVGKYEESLLALLKVKDFDSPLCFYLKGIANEHKGDHASAFRDYNSALLRDPDIVDAHKKRGIYYSEMKEWARAEKDYDEMLRVNPDAFFAFRLRGVSRYYEYRYKEAIDDYTKYLAKDSSNREVIGYRGMAYQKNKQVLHSTLDFIRSKNWNAIEPFPVIRAELDKLTAAGDTTAVLEWLDRFSDMMPRNMDGHRYALNLLMSMNKWEEAGARVDNALLRSASTTSSMLGIGLSAGEMSFLHAVKGTSLVHLGRIDEGIKELNLALEENKKNSMARLALGKAYLKLNNKSEAIYNLKRAEKIGNREAADLLKSIK